MPPSKRLFIFAVYVAMHVCIGMFICLRVFQHISIVLWKNSFYLVLVSTFSAIVVAQQHNNKPKMICYYVYVLLCLLLLFVHWNPAKSLNIQNIKLKFSHGYFEHGNIRSLMDHCPKSKDTEKSSKWLFSFHKITVWYLIEISL